MMTRLGLQGMALALIVALGAATGGCPTASVEVEPAPQRVVAAYHAALSEGRPDDAFALLHPEAREGMDRERFRVYYAKHRDALVAQAAALVALTEQEGATQRAWVATDRGDVELVETSEGWRLTRPVGTGGEGADDR